MYAIIKSNSGNHSGFNRTWELLGSYEDREGVDRVMFEYAEGVVDGYVVDDGVESVICGGSHRTIYEYGDDSFIYDLRSYMIIEEKDLDLFNGGSYGYLPQSIINLFNNINS